MYILIVKCNGFYFPTNFIQTAETTTSETLITKPMPKFKTKPMSSSPTQSWRISGTDSHSVKKKQQPCFYSNLICNINVFSLIVKCNGFYFLSYKFYSKGTIDNIRNSHEKPIPKFKTKPMSSSQTQSWRTTGTVSR